MTAEIKALESNNTWTLVPLPIGKQCISYRWVYKVKFKPDGTMDRHKARLVVKKTAVYLTYGESIDMEIEPSPEQKENALIRFIKKIVTCDFW